MVGINNLKRLILFSLLIVFATVSKSQTFSATYVYDANGNRVQASVVYLSISAPSKAINDRLMNENDVLSEIRVLPNPTKGNLSIEVLNISKEDLNYSTNSIKVWDIQGRVIITLSSINEINSIDLSNYPNGIYIVRLSIKDIVKNYKIIKE